MYGDSGSLKASQVVIQKRLDKKKANWVPVLPSPPGRPISFWKNDVDQVRKNSKSLLDAFLGRGGVKGVGNAPFWTKKVTVESLDVSKDVLIKHGYNKSKLCLEDLIPWSSLQNTAWKTGPSNRGGVQTKNSMFYSNFLCYGQF